VRDTRDGLAVSTAAAMSERERLTAIVYGDTFALYDEAAFDEFVEPLYARLKANHIDTGVFRGKRCLDAGCGGGRGSVLMAQCGAREVVGLDLSPRNVESARKRAEQKGLTNVRFQQGTLSAIPFDDESFDIVQCNGVLHHMDDPDTGLSEIARVLKTGGWLWLYLSGSGGTYWYVVDWIRAELRGLGVRDCIAQLRLMDSPVRRIAEWVDDWFVAYLRRYTASDVTARLIDLGFDHPEVLPFGVDYDTSQRRHRADARERNHMGEGDLRYFCRKGTVARGGGPGLPDPPDGKGSAFAEAEVVTQFAEPLARVSRALAALDERTARPQPAVRLMVCRSIHVKVRSLLESKSPFDAGALHAHLALVASLVDDLGRGA
jgi:ubiquinone/menaquinone biosynthesis C-methylase UbiE